MTIRGSYSSNFEEGGCSVYYTVDVTADYYYRPERLYLRNGDPGYPEEESYDNCEVEGISEYEVYGDEGRLSDEEVKKLNWNVEEKIKEHAESKSDDWDDWNEPDYPEPPEYEPDCEWQ